MQRRKTLALVAATLTTIVIGAACERDATPVGPLAARPQLHIFPGEELACFRLTGGGRIDKPEPPTLMPQPKNTPDSRDFATFGFQARPNSCDDANGSGQIEWVDHNPGAPLGGFSFHGEVTWFVGVGDHYGETGDPKDGCGRFSGMGRAHGRDGSTHDVSFVVEHACDRGEPGREDHIRICLGTADQLQCEAGVPAPAYRRDGILTGGNIQKHSM